MRRGWTMLTIAALAAALAGAAVVARLRLQDPLSALPRDPAGAVAVVGERHERWQGRTLVHVTLRGPAVREVRFVVSVPDPLPADRLPIVLVLGGLEGGTRSIHRIGDVIGDPGPNALVAYDWPLPPQEPSALEIALRLGELRRSVLSVPGQVDAMLGWASRQRWADPERVSLLGFSLGAFVAPAAQRVIEERGGSVRWTVIAYGGAPIGAVIAGHPGVRPAWAARPFGAGADLLLRPVEPSEHLPRLRGRFLVLRAGRDRLIAPAASDRLAAMTPEPRTVVVVEGDHMGLGAEKRKLLEKVVAISRAWMLEQGALAPARSPAVRPAPTRGAEGAPGGEVSFPR
jgi:dienelactone hydrolase